MVELRTNSWEGDVRGSDLSDGREDDGVADTPAVVIRAAFDAHYRRLVGLASLLVDDPEQAEEIVQDAFAVTWQRWDHLREPIDPLGYLRQTVINASRGQLRRRRSARNAGWRAHTPPVRTVDPANAVELKEARQAVLDALAALPQRQRECVVLRYYGECSVAETSDALDISPGSVKAHTHRALTKLAPLLEDLR